MSFIGLPLPQKIKQHLSLLCCGLKNVDWLDEENFILHIHQLGPTNEQDLLVIRDHLKELSTPPPFTLSLQGVEQTHSKNTRGKIWVGVKTTPSFNSFLHMINQSLQEIGYPLEKHKNKFHILLGHYERESDSRLAAYFQDFSAFQTEPFSIDSFALYASREKGSHSIPEESFPLKGVPPTLSKELLKKKGEFPIE